MSEYCLSCWNRLNDRNDTEADWIMDDDLCEACGEWKPVVVRYRRPLERLVWTLFHARKQNDDR